MWNKDKSLLLSRMLTTVGAVLTLFVMVFIPTIAEWYDGFIEGYGLISGSIMTPMSLCMYFTGVMIICVTILLYKLLTNIKNDRVFVKDNTSCLRGISWAFMGMGIALGIFTLWRFVFAAFAFSAIFIGLVMRVLKNVFEKAVEMKSESDYTI